MQSLDNNTEAFFALLRAGLWNKVPQKELFDDVNWECLLTLAKEQAVAGVLTDGINLLPSEVTGKEKALRGWVPTILRIEEQNRLVNRSLKKLTDIIQDRGINTILLKGQGCASLYPNPLHRVPGDIDLYIGLEQCKRAKELVLENTEITGESSLHFAFMFGDVDVECHKRAMHSDCLWLNRRLQRLTVENLTFTGEHHFTCEGKEIAIPEPTFNAFYVFVHFYHHFCKIGTGLRQISDWALLLKHHEDVIDWVRLEGYVRSIHAMRAWRTFFAIAQQYLGLKLKEETMKHRLFQKKATEKDIRFILNDILTVGNMGKQNVFWKARFNKDKDNYSLGKAYRSQLRRILTLIPYGTDEMICHTLWYGLYKLHLVKEIED